MIQEALNSFLLGLATPLTAACVLPLYPGFISYLSGQLDGTEARQTYIMFGGLVVAGVIAFMLSLGLLFSTLIGASLTAVTQIISPVAFGLLGAISILLILDTDFSSLMPSFQAPRFDDPLKNAFSFGFFFGAIILPCNPGYIAVFLARATLFSSPASSLSNFLMFGFGIGAPLFAFTLVSATRSRQVIETLTEHKSAINRASGVFMLAVSVYYLVYVFNIFGI